MLLGIDRTHHGRTGEVTEMTILGIRREDKSIWERRTPLIPSAVRQLVEQGILTWDQVDELDGRLRE